METTALTLGQLIKIARLEAGLRQKDLAAELGLSYRSIQEYESDRIVPYQQLRAIEEITGKPQGWLTDNYDPYQRVSQMAEEIEEIGKDVKKILALLKKS
jgi:transcriptional regulator with XRE-family HTH domain